MPPAAEAFTVTLLPRDTEVAETVDLLVSVVEGEVVTFTVKSLETTVPALSLTLTLTS